MTMNAASNSLDAGSAPRCARAAVPWSLMALGMAILAIVTFAAAPLARGLEAGAFAAAGTLAAGTLLMAALFDAYGPFPRWARRTSAGVLAVACLASAFVVPDGARWAELALSSAWFAPFWVYVLGLSAPQSRCAGTSVRAGWLLVGTSAAVTIILGAASAWASAR